MRASSHLLIFILLLTGFSCNNKSIELPPSSFSRYISGFTYGVISVRSPLEIELQDNYKGSEKVGDEIKSGLFKISPSVEGRTILKSPNKIVFIPSKPLKEDQSYTISFALDEAIQEVDDEHETFKYTLKTIAPSTTFVDNGIEIVSESANAKTFEYHGMIRTADFVESKEVESNVKLGTENAVAWTHSADGNQHDFIIKNIKATDKVQKIDLDIDLDNVTNSKEDLVIEIPTKNEFTVTSMRVDQDKNNQVTVVFSESLSPTDNEGMCSIQGKFDHSMEIVGNRMVISPTNNSVYGDVEVKILAGAKSKHGKKLPSDYTKVLNFGSQMPSAQIMGEGSIVVDNNGASVPIKTVGLHRIKVEVHKIFQNNVLYFLQNGSLNETYNVKRFGRKVYSQVIKLNGKTGFKANRAYNYSLDLSNLAKLEKGAIYQVRLSFDRSMTANYADDKSTSNSGLYKFSLAQNRFDDEEEGDENDYDYEYYYPEGYDYEKREDPSDDSYYNYERFSKKNFLVSNIGLIAKKGTDNKIYATCVDLLDAKPLSGAKVEVFSYQFQNIGHASADGDGFATISATEKPFFVVATHNNQKAYIKLENYSAQAIDVFDVEGNNSQKGMKCFVYGERGVWRPGDKVYLSMILSNGYNELPKDLPCQMEFLNPSGQVMDRMVVEKNLNGFYSFVTKTATDAPTGNWIARFKVGGLKYDKLVKIETVKPNRLRIAAENESEFIKNGDKIKYHTSWLTGASSAGLKASVDMNFYNAPAVFNGMSAYTFNDKTKEFKTFEQSVYTGNTASDGSFEFNFNLQADAAAIPGMLNAVMTTKVFENGGDFSIQYDTKKFSYYNSYAGHKIGTQSSYYLECDKPYKIDIANVNAEGKLLTSNRVKVGVYRVEYNWWYNSYNSNRYFDQEKIKSVLFEKEVDVINGKAQIPVFMKKNQWGNYLIKVTDLTSNHSSSSFVYFESPYYENTNSEESSKVIQMSKDKDKYLVGETAKLSMVSYYTGRALLSIENGNEVIKAEWFDIKQGKNEISFKVDANMSPNVYAYVSAIQPQPSTKNNLPIRTYGIIPIYVDNSKSVLKPEIEVPARIEPETKLNVKVSESNGNKMTYTLAIVDEGLLGISGYKTPDPWKFFYSKEALGVLTWDVFDEVIGAFTGVFRDVFSIGGGEDELSQMNKAKSNRYESVVKYLGPFELKGGSNSHTIDVPNYVGNLKVMVVAGGSEYKFGSATKDVQVAKPLMVLGTLPRVLSLGEEIELPVNVFVTDKSIKNVQIDVIADDKVTLVGSNKQSLSFTNLQDQIVNFKLKTGFKQGVTKVKIIAKSGRYNSVYEMEVPIRIANPPSTDVQQMVLQPHETKTISVQPIGVQGTNKIYVESSSIPELNIKSKVDELISYPHGCLEQTTSALFPQLYLPDLTTLSGEDKEAITSNIKVGFEKYKSFQSSSGGLSYWPNSGYYDDYATSYATHFMAEAKAKGYDFNSSILNSSLESMNGYASSYNPSAGQTYQNSYQAYRLLVLALANKPNLGAMNRLKEASLENTAKARLALAYSYAGKNDVAKSILTTIPVEIAPYIDDRYTYGSHHLDNAYMLELFVKLGDQTNAYTFFRKNITALNSKAYLGTQTTAMLLKSISSYLAKNKIQPIDLGFSFNGKSYSMKGNKPSYSQAVDPVNGQLTITNNSNAITVVNIIRKGIEMQVKPVVNPFLSLSVEYVDKAGNKISADKIARQTDFKQIIKVTNKSSQALSNMALTNYVPAGWEIVNKRIAEGSGGATGLDYQDIRDDAVMSYFSLGANETKVIIQDFNASYEGSYQVPAIILESMYNPAYVKKRSCY
jgi:uncharacterized protein YfaS (alpha-2-macroglobulin family)